MKVRLEEKHNNKKRKFIKQDLIKYMINSFSTEETKKVKDWNNNNNNNKADRLYSMITQIYMTREKQITHVECTTV